MKKCCKCKKNKRIALFGKNRHSKAKDGYHPECKLCVKKRKAKYYLQNKDRLSKVDIAYKKMKRIKDPLFRLAGNLRSRLNAAIKNDQKSGSAVDDLGCSVKELKAYLEDRMKPGMSWDNYGNKKGQWNIDHILPISRFDLTKRKDILKVCHFSNLQPLWVEENLLKSDN